MKASFWENVDTNGPVPKHCPELGSCWVWKGCVTKRGGYGRVVTYLEGKRLEERAHRISYQKEFGDLEPMDCVCHHCDNPPCIRPSHLFKGTKGDNNRDRTTKGRTAKGEDKCIAKVTEQEVIWLREEHAKGAFLSDLAGALKISEKNASSIATGQSWKHVGGPRTTGKASGDRHHTRLHPERLARGAAHWSHKKPEALARGDRNGSRLHPEKRKRGTQQKQSKLTETLVLALYVRALAAQQTGDFFDRRSEATQLGVSDVLVHLILRKKAWVHVTKDLPPIISSGRRRHSSST